MKRTLERQIQTRVALTTAVMALLLAAMTMLVAQNLLINQLDRDIQSIPLRVQGGGPNVRNPGIPVGTILVGQSHNGTLYASLVGRGDVSEVREGVSALLELPPGEQTVHIPTLGRYRVNVEHGMGSSILVVGLPTAGIDRTMIALSISALSISVLAVLGAVLITRTLIKRATRPLDSLTHTAETVSQLRLDRGPVAVPRVGIDDLPPEHEVARVGSAFNHMLDNVEHALGAREASEQKLRRFVADASHELRNPLAAIHGYSELVEGHAEGLDENTTFALGRISAESRRMRKLVDDMMMLARLDSQQQQAPVPVDAVEVVLNAVSDARASSADHVWRLSLPDEPVVVLAGADQLQQVMVNLLSNARNHTPPGTTVLTEVTPSGVITVTDDGPGISPDVLPRVFERFTRADDARRHSEAHSTGLGLAIVKAQVESFGGQVRVESRPGRTQFGVRLPLANLPVEAQ